MTEPSDERNENDMMDLAELDNVATVSQSSLDVWLKLLTKHIAKLIVDHTELQKKLRSALEKKPQHKDVHHENGETEGGLLEEDLLSGMKSIQAKIQALSAKQRHLINHIKTRSQSAPGSKTKGEKIGESFALPLPPTDYSENSRISKLLPDRAIPSTSSAARQQEGLPILKPIPGRNGYGQASSSSSRLCNKYQGSPNSMTIDWLLLNKGRLDRPNSTSRHPSYYMSKSSFLSMLGLVTPQESDRFKHELEKSKMSRKRRSTANPKYASYTLNVAFNQLHPKRRNCKPVTLESLTPYERNDVYKKMILMDNNRFHELLLRCFLCDALGCNMHCGTCTTKYHSDCIRIPASKAHIPKLLSLCPKCIHERKSAEKAAKEKADADAATAARRARAILASKNRITRAVVAESKLKRQLHPRRKLKPILSSIAHNKETRLRKRSLPVRTALLPPVDENKKVICLETEESDCVVAPENPAIPLDLNKLQEVSSAPQVENSSAATNTKLLPVPQLADQTQVEQTPAPLVPDLFEFHDTDDSEVVILETVKHSDKKFIKNPPTIRQNTFPKEKRRFAKVLRTRAVQKFNDKEKTKNSSDVVILQTGQDKLGHIHTIDEKPNPPKEKRLTDRMNEEKSKWSQTSSSTAKATGRMESGLTQLERESLASSTKYCNMGYVDDDEDEFSYDGSTDFRPNTTTAQVYTFENCKMVSKPKKLDFGEIAEQLKNASSSSFMNVKSSANTIMTSSSFAPVRQCPVTPPKPKKPKKRDSAEKRKSKEARAQKCMKLETKVKPGKYARQEANLTPECTLPELTSEKPTNSTENKETVSAADKKPVDNLDFLYPTNNGKSIQTKIFELEEYLRTMSKEEGTETADNAALAVPAVPAVPTLPILPTLPTLPIFPTKISHKKASSTATKPSSSYESKNTETFKYPFLQKVEKSVKAKKSLGKKPMEKLDEAGLQKFSQSMDAVFEVVCGSGDGESKYRLAKSIIPDRYAPEKNVFSKPTIDLTKKFAGETNPNGNSKSADSLSFLKKKKSEKFKCHYMGKLPVALEPKSPAKAYEAQPTAKAVATKRSRNPKTITMRTIIPTVVGKPPMDAPPVNPPSQTITKAGKSSSTIESSTSSLDDEVSSLSPDTYFTSAFPHSKFSANVFKQKVAVGNPSSTHPDIPDDFFKNSQSQSTFPPRNRSCGVETMSTASFGLTPSPTKPTTSVTPSPTKPVGTAATSSAGNSPLKPQTESSVSLTSQTKMPKKVKKPKESIDVPPPKCFDDFDLDRDDEGGAEISSNVFCIRNVSISCETCRDNRLKGDEQDLYNGGCNGPKGSSNGLSNLPPSCVTVTQTMKAMAAAAQSVLKATAGGKVRQMAEDQNSFPSPSPCNSLLHSDSEQYYRSGDMELETRPSTKKRGTRRSHVYRRRPASPRHPDKFTAAQREALIDRNREIMREMIELKSTELDLDAGPPTPRAPSPSPSQLSNLTTSRNSQKSL